MPHQPLIFDIETGPESEDTLLALEPAFEAPANYKDPEKIAARIEEQRAVWRERAPLDATTGTVLAIGTRLGEDPVDIDTADRDGGEAGLLRRFWAKACPAGAWRPLIGFNSNRFDIPFLVRRSYKLGLRPPPGLTQGRYLNPKFHDLMDIWKCGDFQATISLDRLAKHLGLGAKNGDGANFAHLYHTDRAAALAYLRNDIELTQACALRLGLIQPDY
jgi:predicted PolB exonuclease-like 3'-5' exonuclease